jgi:tetratricopeptide (TPR) repeat protein
MKRILTFFSGLVLSVPLAAQTLLPSEETNEVSDVEFELTAPSDRESSSAQPVFILRDDSREEEEAKSTFLISTAVEYADEGEYEDAERAYLKALEADPDSDEALVRLAALYVDMERFKDAARLYRSQLEKNPENPLANNNLAWCYTVGPDVRNIPLALRHVRESLLSTPLSPSAWNTLAETYYVAGEYDKALRASENALQLLGRGQKPAEDVVKKFAAQIEKIKRAQKAADLFTTLDGSN